MKVKLRYDSKWRRSNPDKMYEYHKRWTLANPDVMSGHRHRRRALMRDAFVEDVIASKVFDRDGWVCKICGESIDKSLRWPDPGSVSLDHIIPLSKGGLHSYDNCQAAHFGCNSRKGGRILGEAEEVGK